MLAFVCLSFFPWSVPLGARRDKNKQVSFISENPALGMWLSHAACFGHYKLPSCFSLGKKKKKRNRETNLVLRENILCSPLLAGSTNQSIVSHIDGEKSKWISILIGRLIWRFNPFCRWVFLSSVPDYSLVTNYHCCTVTVGISSSITALQRDLGRITELLKNVWKEKLRHSSATWLSLYASASYILLAVPISSHLERATAECEKVERTMRLTKGEEQPLVKELQGRWRHLGLGKKLLGEGISQRVIESWVAQRGETGMDLHCPLQDIN